MTIKKLGLLVIAGVIALGMAFGLMTKATAVHDLDLFQLDRNAQDLDPNAGADDWDTLYGGGGSAHSFTEILADVGADGGTQFQGGGSKDDLDITAWLWKPGEPLDKDDITNAYAAAYISTVDTGDTNIGDLIIYFGLDRFSANGSAQVGFWFLQDPTFGLTNVASQGGFKFSGVHMDNDVLVQSNFTNGGIIDNINVYKWQGGVLVPILTVADCLGPPASPGDDVACAVVNRTPFAAPWPYTPKANEGSPGTFITASFFEGGINISRLIPEAGCFTGFMAETRSSTPFDSRLKDFVLGDFELCSMEVTKTGDTLSKVGDPVDYTVTIENTGSLPLYKDDISDSLLGDITIDGVDQANSYVVSNTCGASLAVGTTCTITLQRTVLAGDPDPLPNTVTATYRGKSNLTGIAVIQTDDHSVDLFQPAVAVDKTGSTLSKVGDDVDYVITLSNNSSADTPAITCTATDSLLGVVFDAVLPLGDTVLTPSRTVVAGDTDPLVNTVNVVCSIAGFPNVLNASDGHSTDLFQPAVAVAKTGDTLSKVGDPVNYMITLSNNSSADTPALNCIATDDLLGEVFNGVLPAGDTVLTPSRTVLAGDPDPLVNTVTLACSVAGFSNVLGGSDSHSTNLFQPALAVDKTGDALSKVGDSVDYTITLSNNSSADTPALTCTATDSLFGEVFNAVLPSGDTVLNLSRTVEAGDSDPLVNTVNVSCSVAGFPNILQGSDSHSTNLFQPVVVIDKTGDTLGKVTDPVDYTITLSNNSSADTPALNCTVTDSLLGAVFSGVAPMGDSVFNLSRTVLVSDPDPLVNTASFSCAVAGFPNVLSGSDGHTTELFQPAVEVIKTGPTTAAYGDIVTYDFTINNLSSGDSPNLVLDSVTDDVIGSLTATAAANSCSNLAFGGSCSFTADYTILSTDPNPLVNVVTVHYHPVNFPNDISDTDDHSIDLVTGLGCTPGFWQGGAGSVLWNQVNDLQWTYGGVNPFIHTTLFNTFFNVVTDPRLDGYTMYALVSSGGGSDWAVKAARDMVAAYLNESAFPAEYPATSLADLVASWYAAVTGGDAALSAFHTQVGAWNAPVDPGYCPLP